MALHLLETGVYTWLSQTPALGHPNAGAVIDQDGITVIDTLMVPSQSSQLAAEVEALGFPVKRVALTSAHIEYAGGTGQFRLAAVFGTELASAHLDQPPNIPAYQRFMPEFAAEFEGLETRPVSHVVTEPTLMTPVIEVAPMAGDTPQNLVLSVPSAGVVFAGGAVTVGVTPLGFQADFEAWITSLDTLMETGATIVPGHGPLCGREELAVLRGYLRACIDAAGDPAAVAPGPWDRWTDRHLDAINVERAALLARGEDRIPDAMLRAIGMS